MINMESENREQTEIEFALHQFRMDIDACIKQSEGSLKTKPRFAREMALVRTKLQEAKMWAGKCLEVEGAPFPENLRDEAK